MKVYFYNESGNLLLYLTNVSHIPCEDEYVEIYGNEYIVRAVVHKYGVGKEKTTVDVHLKAKIVS